MAANHYCTRCLHSFPGSPERCPNLACNKPRPEGGWGRLHAPGDLLDRTYRVRERVAVGGAGITYRARELDDADEETGPELAIKVLFQSAEGTVLRRLSNEARVLQELQHPNIVSCRGFVHRTGKPAYLVMEYEAGGNLYEHVRHVGALPVVVATSIAEQMLEALAVAHRREVIHRDLKPQNILLRKAVSREQTPHVLLADFGIAKVSGFVGDNLTVAGTFMGTPEFAAPEQFKGLTPMAPTDVYAASAVFWYCLTGSPPITFRNRTDAVECLRTLREELPPKLPSTVGTPAVRARLQQVFDRTLAFDPEARSTIPSFLESLAELEAPAIGSEPLFSSPMGTMTPDALLDEMELLQPPPPAPVAPAAAAPAPAAPAPQRRAPAPGPIPAARSSMDDLFGPVADEPEVAELSAADLSLDDLFGGSSTPARPAPAPIHDAQWDTLHQPAPAAPAPSSVDWEPDEPVSVGVPRSDLERVQALGRCAAVDRPALLDALEDPPSAIANAGPDVASRCGASLVAQHHKVERHTQRALAHLQHDHPDVRATAALAIGAIGKPAQLTQLNRLLGDRVPKVRVAAVHALAALGAQTDRQDLVLDWLSRHADSDSAVQAAMRRYTNRR